jgi:hypothetical protein
MRIHFEQNRIHFERNVCPRFDSSYITSLESHYFPFWIGYRFIFGFNTTLNICAYFKENIKLHESCSSCDLSFLTTFSRSSGKHMNLFGLPLNSWESS